LRGDEIRECWEPLDAPGAAGTPTRPTLGPAAGWALDLGTDRTAVRLRDFIEVQAQTPSPEEPAAPADARLPGRSLEPGWSFWSELEA